MSVQLDNTALDGFSPYLFWDVDRTQLQVERSRVYIVERVFSHGMLTDWFLLKEIYGKEAIKETVLNLRHLDKYSLSFCVAYFDTPIENFRCYKLAQSNPTHWDY
jgi:hypothetical protein